MNLKILNYPINYIRLSLRILASPEIFYYYYYYVLF